MILLLAVVLGLLAGCLRAWLGKRSLQIPQIKYLGLIFLAFLPQALVFSRYTRSWFTDPVAAWILVLSQVILLVFAAINWRQAGFWLLGLGLVLNLTVISLNGGLMPISPETLTRLSPSTPVDAYHPGDRLPGGKDVLLAAENTHLEVLADRFVTPGWSPFHAAYSLGDVFLAFGMIIFLWSFGRPPT